MPTRITKIRNYKNREIKWRERVEVYRNLNRKGVQYSIRQNGLVVGHTDFVDLKECYFIVQEAGRQRALRTGRRNVHAFVTGYLVGISTDSELMRFSGPFTGRYDMKGTGRFVVDRNGIWDPVLAAMRVRLDHECLQVWMPRA